MKPDNKLNIFNQKAALKVVMIVMTVAVFTITTVMLATGARLYSNFGSKVDDYIFGIGLSIVFILEMLIPTIAEKIFKINISPIISFGFILHCFGGTYLGNVANMYYIFPNHDTVMHFWVGLTSSMLGLALIQFFNRDRDSKENALYMAVMVLFMGIAFGSLWEVFEFAADCIIGMNMQGYALKTGELLVGRAALMDTMVDILFDIAGAIIIAVPVYISVKRKKNWHKLCEITKRES